MFRNNSAGTKTSLLYTNYAHDPVLDKYFAQARFYDSHTGRMLARDPVKRGLNPYPYCDNDPVNQTDPTGEMPHVLVAALGSALVGGAMGLAGSALSQWRSGKPFDYKNVERHIV